MPSPLVTILGRSPEPGRVKTRLAADVGDEAAALVHEALARDVLERLAAWRRSRGGADEGLVLALTGDEESARGLVSFVVGACGGRAERQGGGDLGARIEEALRRRSEEQPGGSFVFGTDAPLLADSLLDSAARALGPGRAVLAPSTDGGFLLLGSEALPQGILEGLPWGGERALEETERALREAGREVVRVEGGEDVDELGDLRRLAAALAAEPSRGPATADCLRRHPEILRGRPREP